MGKQYLNGVLYGTGEIIKFSPYIYSLEEREVGVWTDGKPLYQKTVNFGAISVGTNPYYVSMGLTNIDKVVNIKVLAYVNSSSEYIQLPLLAVDSRDTYKWSIGLQAYDKNNDRVRVDMGTSRSVDSGFITIQYTKTTDTPGSGHYTTNGGEAHHYSTTEQIVGTWIDGKPLYEKVFVSNSVMQTTTQIDISNLDVSFGYVEKCYMKSSVGSTPMPDNGASTIYIVFDSYIRLTTTQEYATHRGANGYICVFRYIKTTD